MDSRPSRRGEANAIERARLVGYRPMRGPPLGGSRASPSFGIGSTQSSATGDPPGRSLASAPGRLPLGGPAPSALSRSAASGHRRPQEALGAGGGRGGG